MILSLWHILRWHQRKNRLRCALEWTRVSICKLGKKKQRPKAEFFRIDFINEWCAVLTKTEIFVPAAKGPRSSWSSRVEYCGHLIPWRSWRITHYPLPSGTSSESMGEAPGLKHVFLPNVSWSVHTHAHRRQTDTTHWHFLMLLGRWFVFLVGAVVVIVAKELSTHYCVLQSNSCPQTQYFASYCSAKEGVIGSWVMQSCPFGRRVLWTGLVFRWGIWIDSSWKVFSPRCIFTCGTFGRGDALHGEQAFRRALCARVTLRVATLIWNGWKEAQRERERERERERDTCTGTCVCFKTILALAIQLSGNSHIHSVKTQDVSLNGPHYTRSSATFQ